MDNNLNEMMGITIQQTPTHPFAPTNTPTIIKIGHCATLRGWQQQLKDNINRNDQYVIVSPGGGKTSPVICWWIQNCLNINLLQTHSPSQISNILFNLLFNSSQLHKIMFLVPTRTLAQQTIHEFRVIFADLLSQIFSAVFHQLKVSKQFEDWLVLYSPNRARISNILKEVKRLSNEIKINPDQVNFFTDQLDNMLVNLKTDVEGACINFIDQKLLCIRTGAEKSRIDPNDAPVIVGIYQWAGGSKVIRSIKTKLALVVADESHQTQSVPDVDSRTFEDISKGFYQVLYDLMLSQKLERGTPLNDTRLILLSGTQNPQSAQAFCQYLNKGFKRNFNVPSIKAIEGKNQANIDIIPDDSIGNTNGLITSIQQNVRSRSWGCLYVIFSINRMGPIILNAIKKLGIRNLDNILNQSTYRPTFQQAHRPRTPLRSTRDLRFNKDNMLELSKSLETEMGNFVRAEARNIQNPFIRLAVSHGIGFIARQIPSEFHNEPRLDMLEADKFIVAKLFKERKIPVLLATDAVGIGVNIDVRRLYIPELIKFGGFQMDNLLLRDLSQILNRAGRAATEYASIHTPSDNVQRVMQALNAGPDNFEESEIIYACTPQEADFQLAYAIGTSKITNQQTLQLSKKFVSKLSNKAKNALKWGGRNIVSTTKAVDNYLTKNWF